MKKALTFIIALALLASALCFPTLAAANRSGIDGSYTVTYGDGIIPGKQYTLLVCEGSAASYSASDGKVLYSDRQTAGDTGVSFKFIPGKNADAVALLYGEFSGGVKSPVVAGIIEAYTDFSDVPSSAWYHDSVYSAVSMGLVTGVTRTAYNPTSLMTWAQAIKLAACMNQLYTDGAVTLGPGKTNWYDTYVDYCLEKGILTAKPANPGANITRADYAVLFAACLPDEALGQLNYVAYGAIPDVPVTAPCADGVYKLYRAGVLTGTDTDTRPFSPDSGIKRSEIAAILVRMMDRESRVEFTLA